VWWSVAFFATFDPKNPLTGVLDPRVRVLTAAIPAALLVYAAAAWDRSGWVAPRWLAWFGDRSYSIYLMHTIVNPVIVNYTIQMNWSHARIPHVLWLAVVFWSGVGAGVALYWLVESRVMAWGKRARKPAPVPATTPAEVRRAA
jgi:peptidoglycan/LPS O-acetylase OafA/YrhL